MLAYRILDEVVVRRPGKLKALRTGVHPSIAHFRATKRCISRSPMRRGLDFMSCMQLCKLSKWAK